MQSIFLQSEADLITFYICIASTKIYNQSCERLLFIDDKIPFFKHKKIYINIIHVEKQQLATQNGLLFVFIYAQINIIEFIKLFDVSECTILYRIQSEYY